MNKILVPTDFSDCAKKAENFAIEIALKANADIEFLHLMDIPKFLNQSATSKDNLPEELKSQIGFAHQYMNDLNLKAENKGLTSKSYISETSGVDVIQNHVKQHNIDLVIMGSHGSSGFKEAFLGSNTQRVLRTVSTPVLIVKNEMNISNIKNVLFASTFKEDVHKAFEKTLSFANIFKAQIHLLYVNLPYNFEASDRTLERMKKFSESYPSNNFKAHIYNAFDEESGILKFSEANQINIITTSTHGKTGFMQMISPSITESLANHSNLPVLSVNLR